MDLRGISNSVSDTVNPNIPVTVQSSTGFTIGAGLRQVPTYSSTAGFAQIQALDSSDLRQLDGLNIQGSIRAIYLRGALAGVVPNMNEWVVVKMVKGGVKPLMDVPISFYGELKVGAMFENGYMTGIYLLEGEKMGEVK